VPKKGSGINRKGVRHLRTLAINIAQDPKRRSMALSGEKTFAIEPSGTWICCQLGARDHYSVPRGLHRRGLLELLITEAWVPPSSALAMLPGEFGERLRQRYDAALADANISHTGTLWNIGFEVRASIEKTRNVWDRIIARNSFFQSRAVRRLKTLRHEHPTSGKFVFAYSYAAREIFRAARNFGFTTILGQIDPGPAEEKIVSEVSLRNGHPMASQQRVPEVYWERWREECDLSDSIIVNSWWSRTALISEGVRADKINVLPVAYDPPVEAMTFRRVYPKSFSTSRPLRVLFLGSLIPRKGIYELLESTILLRSAPVEFWFVGAPGIELPRNSRENPHVHWVGAVPRKCAHQFYCSADIFVLPTHSDGFALTQLEAMAWALPVIASKNCGEVVCHGSNGLVLATVTAEAIANAIDWCQQNTEMLKYMSHSAKVSCWKFRTEDVVRQLLECSQTGHRASVSSSGSDGWPDLANDSVADRSTASERRDSGVD
jgi:glycosyltransferase involved in cell wall biosynthesis